MMGTLGVFDQAYAQISFLLSDLKGTTLINPTSLQFGPDGRLYVSQQDGTLRVYTIVKNETNDYQVTNTEIINLIANIPNHNDDGSLSGVTGREVTGILVSGTASNPVLYVSSSDPRIGAGGSGSDTGLDTNSGIISRLTWNGTSWDKMDLVRGLPRSEENHASNGMQLDQQHNVLYVAQGGHTNAGAPSNNFAFLGEYALAAAILSIDLNQIDALPTLVDPQSNMPYKYDLPTLNDPTRINNPDAGDPFGGNDGLNQAKLVPGGPVQVYSSGYRNPYDLVITKTAGREGRIYTIDNGANVGWGGYPALEGPAGSCTNQYVAGEPGFVNNLDNLHYVSGPGYYAGHPNPVRANPGGAGWYRYDNNAGQAFYESAPTSDWPPVPVSLANAVECDFKQPGAEDGALITYSYSTNGLAEYTATFFQGEMQGNLLAASFDGNIYRIVLNGTGTGVLNGLESFASGFGSLPLDVTAQGDGAVFPGTVWVALYGSGKITVFEPTGVNCTGVDSTSLDDDLDGYSNADEIDNGTNPCSAASRPDDNDKDGLSDLNDPDDDNDGMNDTSDTFAIDANNGLATNIPLTYSLFNNYPGTGFFGLGFTGLMSNGVDNYRNLYDPNNLIAGGAAGLFSIVNVTGGDSITSLNNQQNAFQFGVNVNTSTGPFTVRTRLLAPFFNSQIPQNFQSQGIYIGTGDQDNYLKIVLNADGGAGGIQVLFENGGLVSHDAQFSLSGLLASPYVDLYLSVDPAAGTVQPKYAIQGSTITSIGSPVPLTGNLLNTVQGQPALAVGLIATSFGATPFTATWDLIEVVPDPANSSAEVQITPTGTINASTYGTGSFVIKNTSTTGERISRVRINLSTALLPDVVYDPSGTAGDTTAKGFTVDSDPGVGLAGFSYLAPHNGVNGNDGYNVLEILFNDFNPEEVFQFSIDVDPTSIKGTSAPGPGESGSVSGLELTGSNIAVQFDDGFEHTGMAYRIPNSQSGSGNIIRRAGPAKPGIQVLGLSTAPAVVSAAQQTIRVTGPVGAEVSLLITESALFTAGLPNGGYDIDPFESNSIIALNEIVTSLGSGGVADIPVTLAKSDPAGGLNTLVAVLRAPDGTIGPNSDPIRLQYNPGQLTSSQRINAGGPQVTTGGVSWSADQYFSGSTNTYTAPIAIAGTTDDVLYQAERYGNSFTYSIPVPTGTYTVKLHFAEIYWTSPGNRIFSVNVENGQGLLTNYDIFARAGFGAAVVESFPNVSVTDGFLSIAFTTQLDNAKISAIDIVGL